MKRLGKLESTTPTVYVFLPRLEADDLRQTIGRLRAAEETVNTRAVPQTSAGIEAKRSNAVPDRRRRNAR